MATASAVTIQSRRRVAATGRIDQSRVGRGVRQNSQRQQPQPDPQHDRSQSRRDAQQRKGSPQAAAPRHAPFGFEQVAEHQEIDDRDRRQKRQKNDQADQSKRRPHAPSNRPKRVSPRRGKLSQSTSAPDSRATTGRSQGRTEQIPQSAERSRLPRNSPTRAGRPSQFLRSGRAVRSLPHPSGQREFNVSAMLPDADRRRFKNVNTVIRREQRKISAMASL